MRPDTAPEEGRYGRTDLGDVERIASAAAGLALLATALRSGPPRGRTLPLALGGAYLVFRGASGRCPLSEAVGFRRTRDGGVRVAWSVTVDRPIGEVYRFWRDFQNLPRFMDHLESVRESGNGRSHWVVKGPSGMRIEWDAEMAADRENERIEWRTLTGADVEHLGRVKFRPALDGATEVRVELAYDPRSGSTGAALARIFGDNPDRRIREDLRRFKQLIEAGEFATTTGQASGRTKERP